MNRSGPASGTDGPGGPLRVAAIRGDAVPMGNPELLPAFAAGLAVELAHLRWIVLTQWTCRTCGTTHLALRVQAGLGQEAALAP